MQNVNDNDPEAISNLDEMINLVDSLITLSYNLGNNNISFPEGISTETIFEEITQTDSYQVDPEKRLYITHVSIDNPKEPHPTIH